MSTQVLSNPGCGCGAPAQAPVQAPAQAPEQAGPRLQNLIPLAIVIAAGCEPCAEKMVARALREGSAPADIARTLRIIAGLLAQDCFAAAIPAEVRARMEKPLAAGRRTLEQAVAAVR